MVTAPKRMLGPLYLQPDVALVLRDGNVLLQRENVPVSHILGIAEAIALACLGAVGDEAVASATCAELFPDGARWVEHVTQRYWTYLGGGPSRPFDRDWLEAVVKLRPTFPILPSSTIKREAAPTAITWMVTLGCNRNCPYCFFDIYDFSASAPGSPPDATFPFQSAVRMVREMARIGAADLYLTGGEPLLRRDLIQIVEEASAVRVRTHLTTKYAISAALAHSLVAAGLSSVTLSLDDARPAKASALAGAPGYFHEAILSIRNLLAAGIPLEVNAVVTKVNYEHLGALSSLLASLGVPKLTLSPFHEPYPYRAAASGLSNPKFDPGAVLESASHPGIEVDMGSGASPGDGEYCGSQVCEVGTSALDVLPDGSVSRCHYLAQDTTMVVGSLVHQSILDIWNHGRLAAMTRPPRDAFLGTACSSCEGHEGCNSRGRCYLSALQQQGRSYAPDAFCTRQ